MKSIKINYFLLTTAAGLWGTTFAISRILLRIINVFTLIFFRMAFGTLALLMFLVLTRRLGTLSTLWKINKKKIIFIGIVGVALAYVVQYTGLAFTTTINQSILLQFQVFFVILLDKIFFQKNTTKLTIYGAFIALVGVLLINLKENLQFSFTTIWGDLLTLVACIFYSVATSFSKPLMEDDDSDPIAFNALLLLISSIFLLPFIFISGGSLNNLMLLSSIGWLGLVYLGVFCTGLTFVFWFSALRYIESPKVTVFVYLEPIFASLIAIIILSEVLTLFTITGMVLCFTGVYIAQKKEHGESKTTKKLKLRE
ncbi:MAG: DMT family transporter [Promethearchaeota archaeon]